MEAESEYKVTYKNLLNKFQNGIKLLEYAFSAIDNLLMQAKENIKVWLHFQSLWDLQPDTLYFKLGNNLHSWISCLNEMKESRKSFDTQETQRMFGPMAIDYTKLQSKVNVKFFFVNSHETSREFSIYAQNYVDETIALKLFKHDWHTNGRISQQQKKF